MLDIKSIYKYNKEVRCAGVAEWQTRLFKGQVRNRVGSTPTARTTNQMLDDFGIKSTQDRVFFCFGGSRFCSSGTPENVYHF